MTAITFKTPLQYRYYLLARFYRTSDDIVEKILLAIVFSSAFFTILTRNYYWAGVVVLPLTFVYLTIPLIKFLYARIYFNFDHIEYFFNKKSFGYKIGEYTLQIEKEKIEYIKSNSHYFFIKTSNQKFYFVSDTKQIKEAKKKLLSSDYKNIFR